MFAKKTFIEDITERAITIAKHSSKTIVYADSEDTVLLACAIVAKEKIARPLIVGTKRHILASCARLKIRNLDENNIVEPDESSEEFISFVKSYLAMRTQDGKIVIPEEAASRMKQPHYYAAMLLSIGKAEGMIAGFSSATKPYLPAFEIIKTREGISRASGLFIMDKDKPYFFADCALNINPTAELLAEIASASATTVINFGVKPKIAMLSFSTRDSAKHEMVDKVKNATRMVKEKHPELLIDGELQFDAAIVPTVMQRKCADSVLKGEANVFIFPDLNSGNISYKIAERLGGFKAIGPIMQGLNKPVNDLSRGCSSQDVVDLTAITVLQSLQ